MKLRLYLLSFCLTALCHASQLARTNGPKPPLIPLEAELKRIDLNQAMLGGSSSSSSSSTRSQFDNVYVQNNQGWYPFTFGPGNAGLYVLESFYVYVGAFGGRLFITDCFCAGDRFLVYDEGDLIVSLTSCGTPYDDECEIYQENPEHCFNGYGFCSAELELAPGPHNITMQVIRTVKLGGTGYIKYLAYGRCGGIECEIFGNCDEGIVSAESCSSCSEHSCCSE